VQRERAGDVIDFAIYKLASCHMIISQIIITEAISPVSLKKRNYLSVGFLGLARILLAIYDDLGATLAPVIFFDHIHDAWDVLV